MILFVVVGFGIWTRMASVRMFIWKVANVTLLSATLVYWHASVHTLLCYAGYCGIVPTDRALILSA